MSETNETIADIIAEMRRFGNRHWMHDEGQNVRMFADRLEAAWKREKAEVEASALAAGGMVEASRHKPGGNAAAMREALEFCARQMSDAICSKDFGDDVVYLVGCMKTCIEHMKAALSAPPRNCDVMDWRTAWAKWRTENHPQKPVGYSECYESTTMFMDWYTGTEERKGEGDGK